MKTVILTDDVIEELHERGQGPRTKTRRFYLAILMEEDSLVYDINLEIRAWGHGQRRFERVWKMTIKGMDVERAVEVATFIREDWYMCKVGERASWQPPELEKIP